MQYLNQYIPLRHTVEEVEICVRIFCVLGIVQCTVISACGESIKHMFESVAR